jgi:hypothetical protein
LSFSNLDIPKYFRINLDALVSHWNSARWSFQHVFRAQGTVFPGTVFRWTATPGTVFRCFGLKESCSWNWSKGLIEDSYHKHMMGIGWYTHYIYICIYIYTSMIIYVYNDLEPLYMVSTFAGWLFVVVVFDRPIFYIGNCHNLWTGNPYSPNFVFGDSWIYFLTLLISGWLVAESIWKLKVSFFFNRSKFLMSKNTTNPRPADQWMVLES